MITTGSFISLVFSHLISSHLTSLAARRGTAFVFAENYAHGLVCQFRGFPAQLG